MIRDRADESFPSPAEPAATPGGRLAKRRDARRDAILEAARRVFARRSVFAASITEIAREADYSKAAIYFYFRNKEEIYLSLVLRGQDTYHDLLAPRLEGRADRPALENLRIVWDCLLDLAACQPDFFTLAAALPSASFEGVAPPEIVEAVDRRGRDIFALIRRVIEWGLARGDLSPDLAPGPTAPAIWSAFIGGILHAQTQQKFAGRPLARDPLLDALFRLVACGLLARTSGQLSAISHQPSASSRAAACGATDSGDKGLKADS